MKLLCLAVLLISGQVFAAGYQRVQSNFVVSSFSDFGSRVYYSCDSVERETERVLKSLGAMDISVNCTGGLDEWGDFHTDAFVYATYKALDSSLTDENIAVSIQNVKYSAYDTCHLANEIFKRNKKYFEVSNVSARSCFRPGDRTRIKFDVLKEI